MQSPDYFTWLANLAGRGTEICCAGVLMSTSIDQTAFAGSLALHVHALLTGRAVGGWGTA